MNIATWMIFGFLIGIIAYLVDTKSSKGGIIGSILLSVTGSVFGGLLAELVFGQVLSSFDMVTLLALIAGSSVLLLIRRLIYSI